MIWDTVMFHDEIDVLLCRLTELEPIKDLRHVIIEADVTHQDRPKPSCLKDNWSLFERWHDRIVPVWATDLPTAKDNPDPWAREHAQREWARAGLVDAAPTDVVLHGDVDEIPTVVAARNVRPGGNYVAMAQVGLFWSLRWRYPEPWYGTVAAQVNRIGSFGALRDTRNNAIVKIPDAGWHLSWLPKNGMTSARSAHEKVKTFCHPEVADQINEGTREDHFVKSGIHVDGLVMDRVDGPWPKWVRDGNAPESWFL